MSKLLCDGSTLGFASATLFQLFQGQSTFERLKLKVVFLGKLCSFTNSVIVLISVNEFYKVNYFNFAILHIVT